MATLLITADGAESNECSRGGAAEKKIQVIFSGGVFNIVVPPASRLHSITWSDFVLPLKLVAT